MFSLFNKEFHENKNRIIIPYPRKWENWPPSVTLKRALICTAFLKHNFIKSVKILETFDTAITSSRKFRYALHVHLLIYFHKL